MAADPRRYIGGCRRNPFIKGAKELKEGKKEVLTESAGSLLFR
jgi:hypothetical protein